MAEEAVVVEGLSFMDPFKGLLLTYFMPESCYDEFFLKFNFLDGKRLVVVRQAQFITEKCNSEGLMTGHGRRFHVRRKIN